jgi:predicted transcriptional regulator
MAMTLRLSDEETAALREAAERSGQSMQEVARTAIRLYVGDRRVRRDALIASLAQRDENLLRRLGE